MAPKINFDTFAERTTAGIVVSGISERLEGAKLLHRHVVLTQGAKFAEGVAQKDPQWETDPPLRDDDFADDDALATGTELYVVGSPTEAGAAPTFVTMTWSETVKIR